MNETKARAEMEAIWHPEGVWSTFCGNLEVIGTNSAYNMMRAFSPQFSCILAAIAVAALIYSIH